MIRDHWYPKGTLENPVPVVINDAQFAFPANVAPLMPPVEQIPEEFAYPNNPWNQFANNWFFHGIKEGEFPEAKENIDLQTAFRHISAIMGSWEPKHEYKIAAVAYLMSLWFENPSEESNAR